MGAVLPGNGRMLYYIEDFFEIPHDAAQEKNLDKMAGIIIIFILLIVIIAVLVIPVNNKNSA